jgi:hypothetical protein
MTYLEKAMIRRGHPKHMIVGTIGFLWLVYFVWRHDWTWALAVALLSVVLGWLSTLRMQEEILAQTLLGKIMLLHLHPVNLSVQIVGFALLLYGVWIHSAIHILVATSLVFLGHMWGWHKVNEAL